MKIKKMYRSLKEKFKRYFFEETLTEEQRDYLLSGINPELLENFRIIYFPNRLRIISGEKTILKNGLEKQLENLQPIPFNLPNIEYKQNYENFSSDEYITSLKKQIYENHKLNMRKIRLNHLRKMGEIYSNTIEKISEKVEGIKEYLIENLSDGGMRLSFVR